MANAKQPEVFVGIDRDNTLIFDAKGGYFGSETDWRYHLRFIDGVVEGLTLLSERADICLAVVSNQVGVAKGVLTEQRIAEIHGEMDVRLRGDGITIGSWAFSPYVFSKDAKRWEERDVRTINYDYVIEENDLRAEMIKPGIGLLKAAALEMGIRWESLSSVWMIGDRISDVWTGLNAGGRGILVNHPDIIRSQTHFDDLAGLEAMDQDRVYHTENFMEAAKIILANESPKLSP